MPERKRFQAADDPRSRFYQPRRRKDRAVTPVFQARLDNWDNLSRELTGKPFVYPVVDVFAGGAHQRAIADGLDAFAARVEKRGHRELGARLRQDALELRQAAIMLEQMDKIVAEEQLREPAPEGRVKCPTCGAAVLVTKTGKLRVHDASPLRPGRCAASGTVR